MTSSLRTPIDRKLQESECGTLAIETPGNSAQFLEDGIVCHEEGPRQLLAAVRHHNP